MILDKGLVVRVTLDGVEASLRQNFIDGKYFILIFGPECEVDGVKGVYNLQNCQPDLCDTSVFALLYRKLGSMVSRGVLSGPLGDTDHPWTFRHFFWFSREVEIKGLMQALTDHGIRVVVIEIGHDGNDGNVLATKAAVAHWSTAETTVMPNPYVQTMHQDRAPTYGVLTAVFDVALRIPLVGDAILNIYYGIRYSKLIWVAAVVLAVLFLCTAIVRRLVG